MKHESRNFAGRVSIVTRSGSASKSSTLRGYAAVFGQWTILYKSKYGEIRERIQPSAFTRALREKQDVRALVNHDPSQLLGRTKSGTCRLSVDATGLVYEVDLPATSLGADVREMIRRGDLTGSSFAFRTAVGGDRVTESDDKEGRYLIERDLLDVDLFDVSPVTYPAYEGTDGLLSARSGEGADLVEDLLRRSGRLHPDPAMRARARRLADVTRRLAEGEALAAATRLAAAKARLDEYPQPVRADCPTLSRNWY